MGQAALAARPELVDRLAAVRKKNPYFRADAVVLWRDGARVYVAGANDESHYFAAAELLREWGVRWFMPGAIGECIPEEKRLTVGMLDAVYAPPFEIRNFWVAWLGENAGLEDFQLRNMMNITSSVKVAGHALGKYTKGLGVGPFSVPLSDPDTAESVARAVDPLYTKGEDFSLAMEDGLYASSFPRDHELMALRWDKYSLRPSVTDAMLELLNGVARRAREKHPDSGSKILFLAYSNMFLPPARDMALEPSLFGTLAPIDIDPIHAMGDPQSPPKQEYKAILERWSKLLNGRLTIYDYDQSMLLWRDLPNPTHQAFQQDVKVYRDAGVLGFTTESRMALATTITNLYLRGRLMWNPDENVDALLEDFYVRFFGPAQKPMRDYWRAIFDAWNKTIVTEHEYFIVPAIYTSELVDRLGVLLLEAERTVDNLRAPGRPLSRNEAAYLDRLHFVRLAYETLKSYVAMVRAAATDVDYQRAVVAGEAGLRARNALTEMNKSFTTTPLEKGYAFWSGEVQQYRALDALVNGEKGRLIVKLPLEWSFHRDRDGKGRAMGLLDGPPDLTYWRAHTGDYDLDRRKDYPADEWEMLRTDLYAQAQGVRAPDRQGFTGDIWYRTDVDVSADQLAARPHIHFPGLFGECDLFVNGRETARRTQNILWWLNDARFEWDAPLSDTLITGTNAIALRCRVPHHMGGMFRRPFIYAPVDARTQ
ncbi:DUF4838 domain-containing protein [Methylosinus sp.]|uniref:DUF4838 domain-containing protein n=1 Tax=Methylosinus sp. TaxID=427 RepID=UPI002F94B852